MLPVLFTLETPWGALPIYAYGTLLGVALIAGYHWVLWLGARRGELDQARLSSATLWAALAGLCGARLLYVLENREAFSYGSARVYDITSGGVSAYGGLLGGLLGAALYLRWKKGSLALYADLCAPALAAGIVLARIGCYLHGCDFGKPLSATAPSWLARLGTFPRWDFEALGMDGSPALLHHLDRYGLAREAVASLPVHPTQLYEALAGACLLGFALFFLPRRRFAGQVILISAIGYGLYRFASEYLRDDPERGEAFGFSSAQLLSLLLVPLCAVAYSVLAKNVRR
jgi:phosphatidylglycerol:prolipoprotein diacylglycerol transferase